jgi:hypothetical protein
MCNVWRRHGSIPTESTICTNPIHVDLQADFHRWQSSSPYNEAHLETRVRLCSGQFQWLQRALGCWSREQVRKCPVGLTFSGLFGMTVPYRFSRLCYKQVWSWICQTVTFRWSNISSASVRTSQRRTSVVGIPMQYMKADVAVKVFLSGYKQPKHVDRLY